MGSRRLTDNDMRLMTREAIAEAVLSGATLPDGWEDTEMFSLRSTGPTVPIDPRISPQMLREEANRREVQLRAGIPTAPTGRVPDSEMEGRFGQDPENKIVETISGADFSIHEKELAEARKILLVGIPRSGTTWVGAALSAAKQTLFIDEPDDERRWPQAMYAKRHLSRYPVIAPGDRDEVGGYSINEFVKLWEDSFSLANPFAPSSIIVKSTFVVFCLEWLVEMFKPDAVCWVMRHPMNTLASWMEYKHKLHPEESTENACRRMGWQYSGWLTEFSRCADNDIINHIVWHEDLAADFGNFELLAKTLGLEWNYRSTDWLMDMNKKGDGGHWGLGNYQRDAHINREAAAQTHDRWRERLSQQEQHLFLQELSRWPATARYLDGV